MRKGKLVGASLVAASLVAVILVMFGNTAAALLGGILVQLGRIVATQIERRRPGRFRRVRNCWTRNQRP